MKDDSPQFGVILFHSVQGALAGEKLLETAGLAYKLIAVPRSISSNCGFCLRFNWEDKNTVEKLLSEVHIGVEGVEALK